MIENTYGVKKRLDYVIDIVAGCRPLRVLDIGCGTGANLTVPLAHRFPDIQFVGVDSDAVSIAFANRENQAANLQFYVDTEGRDIGAFDLVIASEVIEHVEEPDLFLAFIKRSLSSDGKVVLTLPNGFGPFELSSFFETIMHITGMYRLLRTLVRKLRGAPANLVPVDTLAVSPHINFFSYRQIRSTIAAAGFEILKYCPRTFLCGFGFDQLMKSERAISWNAEISNRLPPQIASGWMFLLRPNRDEARSTFARGKIARLRRLLNDKRWNL